MDYSKIARKVNAAQALILLLRPTDNACRETHDHFFEIFAPRKARVSGWQAKLLHDLKVQIYIAALKSGTKSSSDVREDLFPIDLEIRLRPALATDDQSSQAITDLLGMCNDTRAYLDNEEPDLTALESKYHLNEYLKGVLLTISTQLPSIREISNALPKSTTLPECNPQAQCSRQNSIEPAQDDYGDDSPMPDSDNYNDDDEYDEKKMIDAAAKAINDALGEAPSIPKTNTNTNHHSTSTTYIGPSFSTFHTFSQQPTATYPAHQGQFMTNASPFARELASQAASARTPQHNVSTQEQYEKARLAATAKAAAKPKGTTPTPSQRRPWSSEEETALMNGLDRVKGPHWSQILAMYGAGGTVSEVLKDRNQVQLKDKARNLKLFFLKSGNEVPPYLKHVTGELKTRAPVQAAKHDAKKQLQASSSEDRATADAISALTGGRRQESPATGDERRSASVAASATPDVATPQPQSQPPAIEEQQQQQLLLPSPQPQPSELASTPDEIMLSAIRSALDHPTQV